MSCQDNCLHRDESTNPLLYINSEYSILEAFNGEGLITYSRFVEDKEWLYPRNEREVKYNCCNAGMQIHFMMHLGMQIHFMMLPKNMFFLMIFLWYSQMVVLEHIVIPSTFRNRSKSQFGHVL